MSLSPVGNRTSANNSSWEACLLKKIYVLTVILDHFQRFIFFVEVVMFALYSTRVTVYPVSATLTST